MEPRLCWKIELFLFIVGSCMFPIKFSPKTGPELILLSVKNITIDKMRINGKRNTQMRSGENNKRSTSIYSVRAEAWKNIALKVNTFISYNLYTYIYELRGRAGLRPFFAFYDCLNLAEIGPNTAYMSGVTCLSIIRILCF